MKPVVQIGHAGASDAVVKQVDGALFDHELIKVKIGNNCDEDRAAISSTLCDNLGCEQVQAVGGVLILFRQNEDPEDQKISLP